MDRAAAVEIHVAATKQEEAGAVLVLEVEGVVLPVAEVIGELDLALKVQIDVREVREVHGLANEIGLFAREDDMAAMVAGIHGFKNIVRVVCDAVIVTLGDTGLTSYRGFLSVEWTRRANGSQEGFGDVDAKASSRQD